MKKSPQLIILLVLIVAAIFLYGKDLGLFDISGPRGPIVAVNDASIGSVAWINVGNVLFGDNLYAVSGTISSSTAGSNYLKASSFSFNIPLDAIINGIVVEAKGKHNTISGTGPIGEIWGVNRGLAKDLPQQFSTISAGYRTVGSPTDLWGTTWTATDINSPDFGMAFRTYGSSTIQYTTQIDYMRITVYYTPATTTSTSTSSTSTTSTSTSTTSTTTISTISTISGTNLVTNPSFESGTFGSNSWDFRTNIATYGTGSIDSTTSHTGSNSFKAIINTAGGDVVTVSQVFVPNIPEGTYVISFWAKATTSSNPPTILRVVLRDATGSPMSQSPICGSSSFLDIGAEWARYSWNCTTSSGQPNSGINMIYFGFEDAVTYWIDDVSIIDPFATTTSIAPPAVLDTETISKTRRLVFTNITVNQAQIFIIILLVIVLIGVLSRRKKN